MRRVCVLLATLMKMRKRALRIHFAVSAFTKTLLFNDFQQQHARLGT